MKRHAVGSFSALEEGVGIRVDIAEHRVAIFLVAGDVFAIGDRCTHAEASLAEGDVYDHEVECPRHGSGFDLRSGKALSLPATKPVSTYPVTVEGGIVYVEVPE